MATNGTQRSNSRLARVQACRKRGNSRRVQQRKRYLRLLEEIGLLSECNPIEDYHERWNVESGYNTGSKKQVREPVYSVLETSTTRLQY
ncbi:unnamed protein product [Pseudo-nitzschia multistriata]|uniref:Uncharacterized protein n=1 Tax=Pseudo-nitzschia multistriata TaxID=183589 RepID=A0A448YZC0_9STRA|nr:unnamed protein product [Pseudo-nitzschia multistriata]